MKLLSMLLVALSFSMVSGASASAEGDASKGERVFRKCKACHSLEAGKKMMGPSLAGLLGRKAGTVEGFRYSKAMAAKDIVWDDETMSAFLKAPRTYIKGTKMAFVGLRKPQEVEDLLAYLKANGG